MFTPIIKFLVFTVVLASVPFLLSYTGSGNLLVPKFWVLFSFVSLFTFMLIVSMVVIQRIKPDLFAQTFLATTIVKMLASMGFALIFVSKIHISHGVFLVDFCYVYFLNTGFEVYVLLSNLRHQN
ncbi:hypothetical protein [Mucilaginibacter terrenus]|uniref:hypothetical protein n=1 Tax=Mucilaginibacter terrenus TaxID=2482727 RepID=UPI001058FDEB|nr:hypothetical protein [Mucilaginibacter terrenus]